MEDWLKIEGFLERFKNIIPPERSKKTIIIEVVKKVTLLNLNEEDILIKKNIAFLNIQPTKKTQIMLNKQKIINYIKNKYPKSEILDIK